MYERYSKIKTDFIRFNTYTLKFFYYISQTIVETYFYLVCGSDLVIAADHNIYIYVLRAKLYLKIPYEVLDNDFI